ncbi:hypothetical protein [Granulicella cerasi]|uniref:hypothetical protein n=1 Tax=Granulicella cerasi TaxID=741063 RepID=UPI0021E04CF1|nr:hypothetical protein [Granulicella cerasi]
MLSSEKATAIREELLSSLLSHAVEIFRENNRINSAIEDKAQRVVTICGIALSAGFVFVKGGSSVQVEGTYRYLLLLAFGAVLASILCALAANRVIPQAKIPDFEIIRTYVNDICGLPTTSLSKSIVVNTKNDIIELWSDVLGLQAAVNKRKANFLSVAQALLFVALLAMSIIILHVISKPN